MTMSRRIAALTAVSALVLAGCSSNDEDTETQTTDTETTTSELTGDATDEPTDAETAPEAVEPVISDEGMPSVVEEDGIVSLDFEGATEPEQLQVSVVEEGDGDVVSPEDLVVVNYAGQVWGSDETFDSSWARGSMTAFGLDMVVQGWRDGLAGQTEGSRVIVSVPAELGYGPNGGNESAGIGPEDTIVFVVDIDQKVSPDEVGDPDATVVTEARMSFRSTSKATLENSRPSPSRRMPRNGGDHLDRHCRIRWPCRRWRGNDRLLPVFGSHLG